MISTQLLGLFLATLALGQERPLQTFPDCVNGPLASNAVCDKQLTPGERASALVAALTTEEKLKNLVR